MQDKQTFKKNKLELKYNFGMQMRHLREDAGLSLLELSKETSVSVENLRAMELGNFHLLALVFHLARFFDKKVEINLI